MNFYTIKQDWSEWSFAEYVYYLHADIMYVQVGLSSIVTGYAPLMILRNM